mgnify:CR=1 FL=1
MFLNEVKLIGNLTRDPELKSTPSGAQVCSFTLATNETYIKDGNKVEKAEFHNCVAWNKTAENIAKYMRKGSQLFVSGKLQTRKYDKEGQTHYRTEVMVINAQFGSKPKDAAPRDDFDQSQAQAAGDEVAYPDDEINPEDIPF